MHGEGLNKTASKNDFSVNGAISNDIDFMIYIGHGHIADDSNGNKLHYGCDSEGNCFTGVCSDSEYNAYNAEMHFGSESSKLRWVWLYTCNFLNTNDYVTEDTLKGMMNGAHIVMGYATRTTLCSAMTESFAANLCEGMPIIEAFFLAGEEGETQATDENNLQRVIYISQAVDETIYSPRFNYGYTTDDIMIITKGIRDET